MQTGGELNNGTTIGDRATEFASIGDTFWGRNKTENHLLVEIREPAYLRAVQYSQISCVLDYEVTNGQSGSQVIVYSHRNLSPTVPNAQTWVKAAVEPSERQSRLLRIIEFVEQLESQESDDPFFCPFLNPRSLAVLPNDELLLLGAPVDIKRLSDEHINNEVRRFIDPTYLAYRNLSGETRPVTPEDEQLRNQHMRYGLTQFIAEIAYDRSIDDWEDLEASNVAEEFETFQQLIDSHFEDDSSLESSNDYFDRLRECLVKKEGASTDQSPDDTNDEQDVAEDLGSAPLNVQQPLVDDDPSRLLDELERKRKGGWLKPSLLALFWFLAGAAAALAAVVLLLGVDLQDPQQIRRFQVSQLLNTWMQEPEQRSEVESKMQQLDPDNINLEYLKLLQTEVTAANKDDVITRANELKERREKESFANTSRPNNPWTPVFTSDDLDVLVNNFLSR